jgi:hypothetical protein
MAFGSKGPSDEDEKSPAGHTVTGQRRRPGRPPVHSEAWTKVTVVLFDRQIHFLDGLAATIRAQRGVGISRAQLIRALIDAVNDAKLDLTASTSEAEVKAALVALLTR